MAIDDAPSGAVMETQEQPIERDRYSLNLVAEAFSRSLSFGGGVLSSIILYRSIETSEYAALKILDNTIQILLPLILLGFTGAIVRIVAEHSGDRTKIGETVGFSVIMVTLAYFFAAFLTIFLGLDQYLLGENTSIGLEESTLRFYWLIVIITMLPSAYLRIAKSAFSGLQQMKRTLQVDIVYNAVRISVIVYLFLNSVVLILNIILLNLFLAILASGLAFSILVKLMRNNNIRWAVVPSPEIRTKMGRLAGVFLVTSLVTANINNVTVLWVSGFGTARDVAFFVIAQNITLTARQVLGAPLAAMGPNLAFEYGRGRLDELARKFKEGYRMMIPTYAFAFAALFAFAAPILRVLYGADGIGATFSLQLLAFNVILVVIPGMYTYVWQAVDDISSLFWMSILQVIMQTIWFVFAVPVMGVVGIATVWIVYIPYFLVVHYHTKKRHGIGIERSTLFQGLALGLIFAGGMLVITTWLQSMLGDILFTLSMLLGGIDVPSIVGYALICVTIIPLWYCFIIVATFSMILNSSDLENLMKVLRVIPPAWWVSKPLMERLWRMATAREGSNLDVST